MRGRLAGVRGWCVIAGLVLACAVGLSVAPSASAVSWASVGGPVGRVVAAGKVPPVPAKGSVLGPGGVVKADGLTRLTGVSPHTTAGQAISTRVVCQLVVRGDLRACSVFRYSNGSVFVRTYGHQIILTVTWSAKANSTTTAYLQVGRWRTNGNATNLQGVVGSLIRLTNGTGHSVRVAPDWDSVHKHGYWRTLQPGQSLTTAGYNDHQAFIYRGLKYVTFSHHSDAGLYLFNGYWLGAHNPGTGSAGINLARWGDGSSLPPVDAKAAAFSGYDGSHEKQLRVGDIVLNAHWDVSSDYKMWSVRIVQAPQIATK